MRAPLSLPRTPWLSLGLAVSATVIVAMSQGCSSTDEPACRVGAECASGVCTSEGKCLPVGADGGASSSSGNVDGGTGDGGGEASSGGFDAGKVDGAAGCTANRDGIVSLDDIPLAPGLRANFRAAADVDVDTAGVNNTDGTRSWDLSGALPGDHAVITELTSPKGTWYETDFPTASYVTRLSESSDLLGVFKLDSQGLVLLGVVSPADSTTGTKVKYDPAAVILSLPVTDKKTWTTDATVSGTASGIYSYYSEKYESVVDARGTMKTPMGTYNVLRVNTLLTRTVGFLTTKIRTFAFLTECSGTIARMRSKDNESVVEFTRAAEVDRIAP